MWKVLATDDFDGWLGDQDGDVRRQVARVVLLLEISGPALGRPYADTLKGSRYQNMKELRINAKRLAVRIAFVFDPQRDAILLVAGDKRGVSERRFYRQLIDKADRLYTQHLAR